MAQILTHAHASKPTASDTWQPVLIRIFLRPNGSPPVGPSATYRTDIEIAELRSFIDLSVTINFGDLLAKANDPTDYGLTLGKMILADEAAGKAYGETIAATLANQKKLRVRLQIEPPELQDIYWERMYHRLDGTWQPMASTGDLAVSRYTPSQRWGYAAPVTDRPLRMLAVISSPIDLATYQLDPITPAERQALHATLDNLSPDLTVTYLETGTVAPPTLDAMRIALLMNRYHMIHVLCHGARTSDGTVLYLEKNGVADFVDTACLVEVISLVSQQQRPAFCFLAACETAARSASDAFVPLGPALVQNAGVQAVIAMSEKIGLATAEQFTTTFYKRLLAHGAVDQATNEARSAVQGQWDWGAPVLFTRLERNQLLDDPAGRLYSDYLSHSAYVLGALDQARAAAGTRDIGEKFIADADVLVQELNKSHQVLADLADPFSRLGKEPSTFSNRFDAFYPKFKKYYRGETWVDENTSCRKISQLTADVMDDLQGLLDKDSLVALKEQLDILGQSDSDAVHSFRDYLEGMNAVVDRMRSLLNEGKVDEAIKVKLAFEEQIDYSLKRNRDALGRMSDSLATAA